MTVDDTLLAKLERLSDLKIEDSARDEVKSQIENIISFVDSLSELDENLTHIPFPKIDNSLPLRADVAVKNTVIDDIMRTAPKTEEHFFVVPKIIE